VAAQEAQLLPVPLTARVSPLLLLLMAENREMARDVALLPQWAQVAGAFAWLMGRSLSKVVWQSAQWYSYTGIALTPIQVRLPVVSVSNQEPGFGPRTDLLYNAFWIRSSAVAALR
jgi:hypothetical protein